MLSRKQEMDTRPTPPDPFASKAAPASASPKPSLADALSAFVPKPIDDVIPQMRPVIYNAPDTGRGGRPKRRGDPETRSKSINFRMKPREQDELNALCDSLNKSIPDTIMILIDHYKASNSSAG
jgi:hypothetical protein